MSRFSILCAGCIALSAAPAMAADAARADKPRTVVTAGGVAGSVVGSSVGGPVGGFVGGAVGKAVAGKLAGDPRPQGGVVITPPPMPQTPAQRTQAVISAPPAWAAPEAGSPRTPH